MSASRQKQTVLIGSLSLSALLAGALGGGLMVWHLSNQRVQDPEFLQRQLERLSPASDSSDGGPAPALVRVGVAENKTIQPRKPIIGRLVEVRKVTVSSEVAGKVIEFPVEDGTPVVGGETVLARIDDLWCRLELDRCKAKVASTEAQLVYERVELERHRQLSNTQAISQSELEAKQATVDELEADLIECKAAVEEGTERVLRSVILAPFDGTVIAKHTELGGYVSPGTPIVEVAWRNQVDALLMVPESIVNMIEIGQELQIHVDPLGDTVAGKVVSVTPYGSTASRTFPVRVRVDDQQGRLKIGMGVTAMIATGPEREALVVSKDAVLVRPDGATVWVAVSQGEEQAAEAQPVPVAVSVRLPKQYAVKPETEAGGDLLAAGASVVVEGAERLTKGQQIRVVALGDEFGETAGSQEAARQTEGPPGSVEAEDKRIGGQES